jgi:hypothetical protein
MLPILQFCTPGADFRTRLLDWQFFEAFTCQYADSVGFLTTGMIVYGGMLISIYLTTGSLVLPAVLLLLVGGAIIGQLAAPSMIFVVLLILGVGAGVMTFLYVQVSSNY